jgi:uncharacterized protein YodC (DUF2158 family)
MSFNVGDTVQLKSGGPIMTVEELGSDNYVCCLWFEKSKMERGNFPAATLTNASRGLIA